MINEKPYKIESFTEKDLFECKLAGLIPDFGYVSISMRHRFVEMLYQNKAIVKVSPSESTMSELNRNALRYVQFYFRPTVPIYFSEMGSENKPVYKVMKPHFIYAFYRNHILPLPPDPQA